MTEWHFESATKLAKAIREKELRSSDLLTLYKERIERYNPKINAVIKTDFDKAFSLARQADNAIDQGDIWGLLHGLPITIKDNISVTGFPCTAGTMEFKDYLPSQNASLIQSLINAGAIVFGKTNLSKLAQDFQTYNKVHGQTNNPWDLSRTPGGSSGGSAAALAMGMTSMEIGNDLGGSIRHPANFCGIYGHKPSFGIVPNNGQIPPLTELFPGKHTVSIDLLVNGPMTRSADDLSIVLDLITKPANVDQKAWSLKLPPPQKTKLTDFKVGFWFDDPACPVDDIVKTRLRRVADALSNAGVDVEEKQPEISFSESFDLFISLMNCVQMPTQKLYDEWIECEAECLQDPETYQNRQILGSVQRHRDWLIRDAQRQMIRECWSNYFQKKDILLCPATPIAAFEHDHSYWFKRTIKINGKDYPYSNLMGWAGLTTLAYLPSTIAPVGLSSTGLPIGIQIVAEYLEDHTAIQFAQELTKVVGGFTPPPNYL